MEPLGSAMFCSTLFGFSGTCWSNHETLYSDRFETHSNDLLQDPACTPSDNISDFVDPVNQLKLTTQSTVIPTRLLLPLSISHPMANTLNSNNTRETSERGTLD